MGNSLTTTGLTTATQAELVAQYTAALQAIYGASINLGSETPDGQWMMIMIQSVLDLEDLLVQIYSGFDPDNAIGTTLDQRVAINGIQRQAGTFTVTNITLVTTQTIALFGLDQSAVPVYTVADNAGTQWQLQFSNASLAAGTHALSFQSATPGAISTTPNTITTPVTIVLGVASINNPSTYTTLGTNEETDAQLKLRRQISVALPSQGYYDGLLAALENIPGVTYAFIEENDTGVTNADGVPGHSIWVIVAGSGAASAIAQAIYVKRNAGCGMYNTQGIGGGNPVSFNVTQADGTIFTVKWDTVVASTPDIKFTATSIDGVNPPNIPAILTSLPTTFTPAIAATVNINDLATDVQLADPNTLVTNAGFSATITGSYTPTFSPPGKNFQIQADAGNIIITPMYITSPDSVVSVSGGSVFTTLSIVPAGTETFVGLGGFSTHTWSFQTNGSSGSTINSSTGTYVAGSAGVDVVKVSDSFPGSANTAVVTITVT